MKMEWDISIPLLIIIVVALVGCIFAWRGLMEWKNYLPLLITTIVALSGWFLVNGLSSQRDQTNKRRELCVQYLHEAYQNLMDAACYSNLEEQESTLRLITKASANIQLFGNYEQIRMDGEFNKGYSARETVSLTELLEKLRSDLRKELKLPVIKQKLHWFKAEKKNQDVVPVNSKTDSQN